MDLLRKKSITDQSPSELRRCLTAFDLTLLGIGAVIGAGIFVLTGIAAAVHSGPAIIVSYILAGLACAFSALSYAELAASIGGCGSAYGYAYVGFGELMAWIIGWDLLLEYGVSCSAVAIGWSGYVINGLQAINIHLPRDLILTPHNGGLINLPAVLIVLMISVLLALGVRKSARFNAVIVSIKLFAIAVFMVAATRHFNVQLWHPFMPFGWGGVVSGAALIFFAYIGFDAVSTSAEEAINPQRDLPIGIIASLTISTLLYVLVAGLLTGITRYSNLNVSSPVAEALLQLNLHFAAGVVAVGAIAGLTTVILVMYYGFTRVFLAMARDGLLPAFFAKVNPQTKTPVRLILIVGVVMAIIAGFTPMQNIAELVNIGTLAAFILVCGGVIILRYTQPNMPRPFKTPWSPVVPALGILLCAYLIAHLDVVTWWRFLIWMLIGFVVYFWFSRKHSRLNK
jgi:APA family basic amino acid/polyamine antiporter